MNDKIDNTGKSDAPQQPGQHSAPAVNPLKSGDAGCCKPSSDKLPKQQKEPADDSTEWPNAQRTGDRPTRPIEGLRRDQQPQGSAPVGEEDKHARADQNPGYSPFRPQSGAKSEGASPTDHSTAKDTATNPAEIRPVVGAARTEKDESHAASRTNRGASLAPMKAADAAKVVSQSTPLKKAAAEHNSDGDDVSSRT